MTTRDLTKNPITRREREANQRGIGWHFLRAYNVLTGHSRKSWSKLPVRYATRVAQDAERTATCIALALVIAVLGLLAAVAL